MKKITLTLFALLFAMLAAAQTYRSLGDIRLKKRTVSGSKSKPTEKLSK